MKKNKKYSECYLVLGVLVGGVLGLCVGFAFENLLLYTSIGVFFGLIIGVAMSNKEGATVISVRDEKKPAVKKTTTKKAPAKKSTAKKTTKKTTKK